MKRKTKIMFCLAMCMLVGFSLWTVAVCTIDVQAIGPRGSTVGFATINGFFHNYTGVHMSLYTITDWLGLVPIGFALGFAVSGLVQWIKRRKLGAVDYSLFVLGGFYIVVIAAYVLFEMFAVNYRPVLIAGYLEASYPSSTTLLVLCVMPTAMLQFYNRIKNITVRRCVNVLIAVFIAFMVIGRLISGVHWLTDIIGGVILSAGLLTLYYCICNLNN